jgi:hypothetical protein
LDILKQVKEILAQQNPQEKYYQLDQLCDVLEYHHRLNETDVVEGIQLLLPDALQEDNKEVREALFRTMDKAIVHHDIRARIDWDKLLTRLPSLGKWELVYLLEILGFSGQVRYLPILEEYAHHADPEIREWADDAIENINSQITHTTDFRKAG